LEHTVITLTMQPRPSTIASDNRAAARATTATGASRGAGVARASGRNTDPSLVAVRDGLWRVVDRTGAVLGHIERQAHTDGDRYLARRIVMSNRRIDLGAFWRMQDAADCFR
jgi:hypothetical protein